MNNQGRVVIKDPAFIGPLYYCRYDDWYKGSSAPLGYITMSKDEATLLTPMESKLIIEEFNNSYHKFFGFNSVEDMAENGITISFEEE